MNKTEADSELLRKDMDTWIYKHFNPGRSEWRTDAYLALEIEADLYKTFSPKREGIDEDSWVSALREELNSIMLKHGCRYEFEDYWVIRFIEMA